VTAPTRTVALPGTEGFTPRAPRPAPSTARRAAGVALVLAGVGGAGAVAWLSARPGVGGLSLTTDAFASWLPLSSLVIAAAGIALVVAGCTLAIERDAPRLSKVPIAIAFAALVLGLVFLGPIALLPAKFGRAEPALTAAAEHEMTARHVTIPLTAPLPPECTTALDPAAFAGWIDDPRVCGLVTDQFRQIRIVGPGSPDPFAPPSRGLVYAPGATSAPSGGCVRQLSPDWWEYSSLIDGVSCPAGLDFTPVG
jgi:hypothetical protein